MDGIESHYVDCQCSHFMHTIRFNLDPEDGSVYLDVHLTNAVPWYRRIVLAIKYVFGYPPPAFGHYDCTLLDPKDYNRIHDILDRSAEACDDAGLFNKELQSSLDDFHVSLDKLDVLLKG